MYLSAHQFRFCVENTVSIKDAFLFCFLYGHGALLLQQANYGNVLEEQAVVVWLLSGIFACSKILLYKLNVTTELYAETVPGS